MLTAILFLVFTSANAQTPIDTVYEAKDVEVTPELLSADLLRSGVVYQCVGVGDTTGMRNIMLSLIIDISGKAYDIQVIQGVSPCYDSEAVMIASRMRFKPAFKGGVPVAVRCILPVAMQVLSKHERQ